MSLTGEEFLERIVRLETRQQFVLETLENQQAINKELASQRASVWGYIVGFVGAVTAVITLVVEMMRGK